MTRKRLAGGEPLPARRVNADMICVKRSKYGLLQALQSSLAKQTKAQAVTEFKHSVVAHKWRARVQHKIPFLDMRSLVAAGLVC
uniref:Uncharacterized protein n=1 Tax=Oryza meridionalis TaxID=40149 RepID=A0A0E0E196_9ORYZ